MADDVKEYLLTLATRAERLTGVATGLREDYKHRLRDFEIIKDVLRSELIRLNEELAAVDACVALEAVRTKNAVFVLQQLALREHLVKLNDNIETWQPSEYVTKEEFLRTLSR